MPIPSDELLLQFTTLALLGLSALVSALPITTSTGPIDVHAIHPYPPFKSLPVQGPKSIEARAPDALDTRDARAATIYKSSGAVNDGTFDQSTFLPANNYCTNISVIPGGFDGKIKSLSVEKGSKCSFYQEEGCGINDFTGGGAVLEVGSRKYKDVRRRLYGWEGKIASAYCQRL